MVWWKLKLFRMLLERKFLRANNYSSFCVVMLWERNPSYILLWSWLNFIYLLQTLNPLSERPEDERVLWNFLEKFPKWGLNWKKKKNFNYSLREIIWAFGSLRNVEPLYIEYISIPPCFHLLYYKRSMKDLHLNSRNLVIIQMKMFKNYTKWIICFNRRVGISSLLYAPIYISFENLCFCCLDQNAHTHTHNKEKDNREREK